MNFRVGELKERVLGQKNNLILAKNNKELEDQFKNHARTFNKVKIYNTYSKLVGGVRRWKAKQGIKKSKIL